MESQQAGSNIWTSYSSVHVDYAATISMTKAVKTMVESGNGASLNAHYQKGRPARETCFERSAMPFTVNGPRERLIKKIPASCAQIYQLKISSTLETHLKSWISPLLPACRNRQASNRLRHVKISPNFRHLPSLNNLHLPVTI